MAATLVEPDQLVRDFDENFLLFHDLMRHKVREILLVSSPYDAFVLEEDGSLASQIINEYHGLNLSAPPRLTHAETAAAALDHVRERHFDLVLTMPFVDGMNAWDLGRAVKEIRPRLPVVLLSPRLCPELPCDCGGQAVGIDRTYVWTGDASLLLAIVKNVEDHANAGRDTVRAQVRVLLLIEDSPAYLSTFLPLLYREIVRQTQAVLEDSLNEEHRLLKMRARPKILVAANHEEAIKLFRRYREHIFGIIADTRFPRGGEMCADAGVHFLKHARAKLPDLPLLMMSAESGNRQAALAVPAVFIDKNDPELPARVHHFFLAHLGFGDFVFRLPDGTEVGRVSNLHGFERMLGEIPAASLLYHAGRNHFSNWLMARSEVELAGKLLPLTVADFSGPDAVRRYLVRLIHAFRQWRQLGVIATFRKDDFDPSVVEFIRVGEGSLGGKARGIAFMASLLRHHPDLRNTYRQTPIRVPRTLVIASSGFTDFVEKNSLYYLCGGADATIARRFRQAVLPQWLVDDLSLFLEKVRCPLAVRSSSLLEDAHFQPYAGLYSTFMLANDHPDFGHRLQELCDAVKLVYASTYYRAPRAFSRSIGQTRSDAMAVIIQQLIGRDHDGWFHPAAAGVAQSHHYYPVPPVRPDDGMVNVVFGFGKAVVEGGRCLSFSPRHPGVMPQFSTVADTLRNSQRHYYALRLGGDGLADTTGMNLVRREVADVDCNGPARLLCSSYFPEEDRIRPYCAAGGVKLVTCAPLLAERDFPFCEMICDVLEMGRVGMGAPVEIEFALDLPAPPKRRALYLLQIRPMVTGREGGGREITAAERQQALLTSGNALGHGRVECRDLLVVRPEVFTVSQSPAVAREISRFNARLAKEGRRYLLLGPGRWGSADPLLGIPVGWSEISAVAAMVELVGGAYRVEPSQGTHFFQNITSLGILYLSVDEGRETLDYSRLWNLGTVEDGQWLRHVRLEAPLTVAVDGRRSAGVVLPPER